MVCKLLSSKRQSPELLVDCGDKFLDRINLFFFEVGFATLATHPGGDLVERNVKAQTVYMKRGRASFHFALTMDALHFFTLTVKFSDHSSRSGTYAVITAR
jgi:hypothetical protein